MKDAVIDVLRAQLKGVTVLIEGDEHLGDHDIHCVNFISSRQKNVSSTSYDEIWKI